MRFKKIIKLFENGNVCVTGLRGTGKDLLFGNVIARRKELYLSNLDYDNGTRYIPLQFSMLDLKTKYNDLLLGKNAYFEWGYPPKTDVYLSDAGIYFPSQYCNELNKQFPSMPMFQALSRQIARNNFHVNTQNLNRVWDKIREQSDTYITCNKCWYIKGLVIQVITIYERAETCVQRVRPCRIRVPFLAKKEVKEQAKQYLDNFDNLHGKITRHLLVYFNKSKHDTYYFEKIFVRGEQNEK